MRSLFLLGLFCALVTSCADPCTGHIESTVLYFKEGPNHQGQLVYANVVNKPGLGVKETLFREDKEFGTFDNIIIISDPTSKFKGRRTVCFDEFTPQKPPADIDLREQNIQRILITR
ncbi:MAG: hypothetical protein ACRYFX_31580 [Janthinobacterium lividum]